MKLKIISLILIIVTLFLTLFFNKKEVKGEKLTYVNEFKEIHYEIKKCFLFKKYCFINSPKTYKLLKAKVNNLLLNEDCLNLNCERKLSVKEKLGMSIIEDQSFKLKKIKKLIFATNCSKIDKINYYNYIKYLSLLSSVQDREQKRKVFKNLNLKKNLEFIREKIILCEENNYEIKYL